MAASPVLANRTFSATIMAHMHTLSPVPSPVGVCVTLRSSTGYSAYLDVQVLFSDGAKSRLSVSHRAWPELRHCHDRISASL